MQVEATRALADMARDALRKEPDGDGHHMAIDVRDDEGLVLQVKFTFAVERHRH